MSHAQLSNPADNTPSLLAHRPNLALPVIGAPMFLASNIDLVLAQCCAGIIGCFPALNARPQAALGQWIDTLRQGIAEHNQRVKRGDNQTLAAPFGVNLILHPSNDRQSADLATLCDKQVPLVITSVGRPAQVVAAVHNYGGEVWHDVTTVRHARRAIADGVDGLILVCAGAGGHGGNLSPFAFIAEVRRFWSGPIALAGAISTGEAIAAATLLGADFAYMGSRFLATAESGAVDAHKQMMVADGSDLICNTAQFSGMPANYLARSARPYLKHPDLEQPQATHTQADSVNNAKDTLFQDLDTKLSAHQGQNPKAWKDIWSAGQGIGAIDQILPVSALVEQLKQQYHQALSRHHR